MSKILVISHYLGQLGQLEIRSIREFISCLPVKSPVRPVFPDQKYSPAL